MKLWLSMASICLLLLSCRTVQSTEYGVISDSQKEEGLYYFKLYEEETLNKIFENNKEVFDENTLAIMGNLARECILCRFTCTTKSDLEINKENVVNICNKDPMFVRCENIGFNEDSLTYDSLKDKLSSDDIIIKMMGEKSLNDYFEERLKIFDMEYQKYYSSQQGFWLDKVGLSRYICPVDVGNNSLAAVYDDTWEEIEEGKIYKLLDKGNNDEWATYYHATDEKIHSLKGEDPVKLCNNLDQQSLISGKKAEWYPISSENFDYVNEKNMAVSIQRRMKLGTNQCFITQFKEGNDYFYKLKSFSGRDCSKGISGRLICVSNIN